MMSERIDIHENAWDDFLAHVTTRQSDDSGPPPLEGIPLFKTNNMSDCPNCKTNEHMMQLTDASRTLHAQCLSCGWHRSVKLPAMLPGIRFSARLENSP